MAVFYVWFPLLPDGAVSAAERMGLLTGIRLAGGDWATVERASNTTYSTVSRASNDDWTQITRA